MDDCPWCSNISSVSKINPMLNQSYTPLEMTKCIWAQRWILCSWGTRILQSHKALEVQSVHGKKWQMASPRVKMWPCPCLSSSWECRWEKDRMRLTTGGPASRFHFVFNCLSKTLLSIRSKRYYFFSFKFEKILLSSFESTSTAYHLGHLVFHWYPTFWRTAGAIVSTHARC